MDRHSKTIFTVIAVSLMAIAINMTIQNIVIAQRPTFGDLYKLRDIKDPQMRMAAKLIINKEAPLVYVVGGNVNVSGSVSVDQ